MWWAEKHCLPYTYFYNYTTLKVNLSYDLQNHSFGYFNVFAQ